MMLQLSLLKETNFNKGNIMKKYNAFGAIELLLGMLVMAGIFVMLMPSVNQSTYGIGEYSLNTSPQEAMQKANDLSNEIDKLRRTPIDINGSLN